MSPHSHSSHYARIYKTIRKIPFGKVATYGQIAKLGGLPRQARLVGYALFASEEDSGLPWHRVVNAKGEISYSPARRSADRLQRILLKSEGIVFNERGRIDLARYLWQPSSRRR